jgi:hypothetical protein
MTRRDMIDLFREISEVLEGAFHNLESKCPSPKLIPYGNKGKVFRYEKKNLEAAIIQKTARMISGLNASLVLLKSGYIQELGALFRMLDEFNEDILFLCQGIRDENITELHEKYLSSFYQEEFDDPNCPISSTQNRPTVQRKKIHSFNSRIKEQEMNESDNRVLHRTLSQAYSGYVHGASSHIMEMYGGNPRSYHLSGMLGTPRIPEFENNAWDYFYRGLITFMIVALTFKEEDMLKRLYKFRNYVEESSGRTEWENPEVLMKREKLKKS